MRLARACCMDVLIRLKVSLHSRATCTTFFPAFLPAAMYCHGRRAEIQEECPSAALLSLTSAYIGTHCSATLIDSQPAANINETGTDCRSMLFTSLIARRLTLSNAMAYYGIESTLPLRNG